jgi:hypothetical protein
VCSSKVARVPGLLDPGSFHTHGVSENSGCRKPSFRESAFLEFSALLHPAGVRVLPYQAV